MRVAPGIVALGLVASVAAQEPQPPQTEQPPPVFRTGANLVRVDVTVTDRRGEPAASLTADDFEVEEDGVPQTVQTFKFVSADGRATERNDSLAIRSPEHAAAEAARDDVRVFLIFWDEYHIDRMGPAITARKALTDFVATAFGPTDLVALMDPLLPSDAIAFTRDFGGLAQKIQKLEGRAHVYLPPRSAAEEAMLEHGAYIERLRSEVTISALKSAAYHLGTLKEGRKSIVFVSSGLPNLDPMDRWPLLQDMMNAANNNNVALYTVDPRGLTGSPSEVLLMFADNTGGHAFVNTNAPARALRQVVRDASAFYLLGYAPVRAAADGKFHKIKVRVKRPGLDVHARQGYWAPTVSDMTRAARDAANEPSPDVSTALSTLSHARPERRIDIWTGTSRSAAGAPQVTLAWTPRGQSGQTPRGRVSVAVERGEAKQTIEAPLDAHQLVIPQAPGTIQLRTVVRDADGGTIDEDTRTVVVPDFAAPLVLGSPVVVRARNAAELRSIAAAADTAPFAGREFARTERLFVRFTVYGAKAAQSTVSARLLSKDGSALLDLKAAPQPGDDRRYQIDLPLSSVARGDYLIKVEAVAGDDRTESLVPIRIVS